METNPKAAERTLRRRLAELRERFLEHEELIAELERFERGEPEVEERAQESDLAAELSTLGDREQIELREVLAALRKLRDGGYGTCERCGGEIAPERLEALPATRYCRACAEAVERERPPGHPLDAPSGEPSAPAPVAAAFDGLSDTDLRDAVIEVLRSNGDEFEQVDAVVESGRVRLVGTVPTDAYRTMAVDLVADHAGIEVGDDLEVDELAFPSSGRAPDADLPADQPEVQTASEVREETEDVYESDDGGLIYSPPDRPPPPPRRE